MTHSPAYLKYMKSPRWQKKSRWVRSLTRPCWLPPSVPGRCVLMPWLAARETHHLTYYCLLNFGYHSFGWELPILHLVPLSKTAHEFVGKTFLWEQPFRFFVNFYLRLAFLVLWTLCKPFWAVPIWCAITLGGNWLVNWLWSEKLIVYFPLIKKTFTQFCLYSSVC